MTIFQKGERSEMRVGVLGINHKLADLKLRETLAKTCQKQFGTFQAVHGEHSFILLSTCNRTEIYFSSSDLTTTHTYLLGLLREGIQQEFEHKLYSYFGVDCFNHLARVTAGLDSAIIAETEIQRQVKVAYEATADYHSLPHDIHFLFQKSLGIAKKVRSELQLGRGMPNIEHAILQTGLHFFKTPKEASLLFVGASEINQKILGFLKGKNFSQITLCNRSHSQGEQFAEMYGVELLPWGKLDEWNSFDWIIFGTKSPEYLIKQEDISNKCLKKKLVMDLCVPRNVDPKVGKNTQITLMNIDQINRLLKIRHRQMTNCLAEAEKIISGAASQQLIRFGHKTMTKESLVVIA